MVLVAPEKFILPETLSVLVKTDWPLTLNAMAAFAKVTFVPAKGVSTTNPYTAV